MSIKATVYSRKEPNKFARKGYIYCWYYQVMDTTSGNVLASDNTADGYKMLSEAVRDRDAIARCAKLGIIKKSRGW